MNILYLIGNGFDVSLGMKTRYDDFYDYYCALPQSASNKKVCELKSIIQSGKEDWSDLESALGRYTNKLADYEEFERVYYDLSDALVSYLRAEESKLDLSHLSREDLLNYFTKPSAALTLADRRRVGGGTPSVVNNINIISFNYTHTIENILNYKPSDVIRGKDENTGVSWQLGSIIHVHGTLDEDATILLGVNDPSQIANAGFAENEEITDILVKPYSNRVLKQEVDVRCRYLINRADIIVLFGLSIGETDIIWWQEILNRVSTSSAIVIIYHFNRNFSIKPNRGQRLGAIERQVRQNFLRQAGSKNQESIMHERILVGVNTEMFKNVKH